MTGHRPRQNACMAVAVAIGLAVALPGHAAKAQQKPQSSVAKPSPDGNTRQYLEVYTYENGDQFVLELVTIPPGGQIAPHVHPVAAHNYILEGEVDSQYDGEDVKHLKAGDTVQDKIGVLHKLWRNTSASAPLRVLIAFTVRKGQPFLTFK